MKTQAVATISTDAHLQEAQAEYDANQKIIADLQAKQVALHSILMKRTPRKKPRYIPAEIIGRLGYPLYRT